MKNLEENSGHGYSECGDYTDEKPAVKNIFKPILFSTEMVQAILAGRKTQTRRSQGLKLINEDPDSFGLGNVKINGDFNFYRKSDEKGSFITPNFKIGNILWVRETHKVAAWNSEDDKVSFYYKASPGENFPMVHYDSDRFEELFEKTISELDKLGEGEVDNEECTVTYKFPAGDNPLKWKPSLFMPKEACRIFLKVTNVRCERLNDISRTDALMEGIKLDKGLKNLPAKVENAKLKFKTLWDSINKKKAPWESNPWVWVYEFEKIEKPADFI